MRAGTKGDYEVGYGKPPRGTGFKKGLSGNPRGRPPGSKNLATLLNDALNDALNEPVTITENGRRRKITKREAVIKQLVNKSASSDARSLKILLDLMLSLELPQNFDRVVQSWDTANKATELSDFSMCTSWGIKGKDLYLLDVAPAHGISRAQARHARAIRAVPAQCRADRGQGLGYPADPGADPRGRPRRHPLPAAIRKVMRMHAQTAMIENGFFRVPESAPWLAQYLNELTVFPNGRHDDQVDSTTQLLDWFKEGGGPSSNAGLFELYRQRAEELRRGADAGPSGPPARPALRLACPAVFRHPPRRGTRRHGRNDARGRRATAASRVGEGRSRNQARTGFGGLIRQSRESPS
jgi:predicted phage terminase large subunit-like protein